MVQLGTGVRGIRANEDSTRGYDALDEEGIVELQKNLRQ